MQTRFFTAACAAAAIGLAMPVAAQSSTSMHPKTNDDQQITITGCLQKNKSGGFWLTNAKMTGHGMMNRGSSSAATTGTTGSSMSHQSMMGNAKTWNLENGDDLDQYVGQKIQVTGNPEDETSGDQLKGTTGSKEMHARDIDVKSVKMIAASCK